VGQVTPKPLRGEDTPEKLLEAVSAGGRKTRNPWPERDVVVVALGLIAGVRSAEMRALQVGSIVGRAGEKRLHVVGKGSKERSVPIADSMIRIIDAYVASGKAKFPGSKWGRTDPLIRDNSGEEIGRGALDYLVQQCFRSAGLHDRVPSGARLHALRHTFATRLAEDGASATEIMGLLGHASLTSSQNYIEATGAHRRQAAAANRTYQALDKLA
jgi:site-specific recombinase XerD